MQGPHYMNSIEREIFSGFFFLNILITGNKEATEDVRDTSRRQDNILR